MKHLVKVGATSRREYIFVPDSSVTTGAGKTGLAYNTGSLVAYYVRVAGSATAITLATQTVTGSYSSGGFVEVDSTNMPGCYRFDIPDAAFASGVNKVVVMLKGAANMAPVALEYQLVAFDPDDTVRFGLTALPNAAAEASGGIYTRGTGAGQINQANNGQVDANAARAGGQTVTAAAGVTLPASVASSTLAGDFSATMKTSLETGVVNGLTTFDPDTAAEVVAAIGAMVIETGISASASLTNDTGTQLTAVNLKQVLALCFSAMAGVLSGAATSTVTIKQGGKPAGNSRIVATTDASGNRSALTLKVPD